LRMAQSAGSFTQSLRFMFAPLYRVREAVDPVPRMRLILNSTIEWARQVEPLWDDRVLARIVHAAQYAGQKVQLLQHGNLRMYCVYVVVALVGVLLLMLL